MRQISLRQLTIRYIVIMLSLVAFFSITSFFNIKNLLNESHHDKQLVNLQIKAYNISLRINFYRDIMAKLVNMNEVKDLVVFGDDEEAQAWALKMQSLIPDSISVALYNEDGEVLGKRRALRVGELCYIDLHQRLNNKPLTQPPVHRETESFAHFDLFQNIENNNQIIGVLFSSFKLSILQSLLDRLTEEGQNLEIYTGDNQLIVATNYFEDRSLIKTKSHPGDIIPIIDSDWYLKAYIEKSSQKGVLTYITYASGTLFALLSAMLFIFSNRLVSTFSSDFRTIQTLLLDLKNHKTNTTEVHSKLRETEGILTEIKNITEDISNSQQQLVQYSHHDDLTGLLNRRGFFQEASRSVDLAKRSIESSLILIDLDHFKQMNDALGHAIGDQVLKILSGCIKSSSRTVDIATRLGGDEFAVILVSCDSEHAIHWYNNLSEHFAEQQKTKVHLSKGAKYCSLSAGCTSIEYTDSDISAVVARADEALYTAKDAGRGNIKPYQVS